MKKIKKYKDKDEKIRTLNKEEYLNKYLNNENYLEFKENIKYVKGE